MGLIPPQRPVGACPHSIWGGVPSLFGLQGAFLPLYRESSLTSVTGTLPLDSSRAQLLPLVLALSGASLHLTNTSFQPRGPSTSYLKSL